MAIFGYVRHSLLKGEKLAEGQIANIARKAEELGGSLAGVFVDPGSPGKETAILGRPAGKEMLDALQEEDTLIVNRLDRLGYSAKDVRKTLEALSEREVRVFVLHALDGEMDLPPAHSNVVLCLFDVLAKAERKLRSERSTELAHRRKEAGLAYGAPPMGEKIVERNGVKFLERDLEQLQIIAEIAERLPSEGAAKVAQDFWRRGIKDRHGRLWGKRVPKPATPVRQANRVLRYFLGDKRSRHATPYQQFHRAAWWFHRMKRKGLLPPPYGELGMLMEEPEGFREERKPKKWTPGGTAQREKERADLKAKHHAEQLARWARQKAERVQKRVHKPKVGGMEIAPVQTDEGAAES